MKKYIVIAVVICFAIFLVFLSINKERNGDIENDSGEKNETSFTVDETDKDDTVDDESTDGEIDTWIEPEVDSASHQNSNTDEKDEQTSSETEDSEEEKSQENEKPEWIGGDF